MSKIVVLISTDTEWKEICAEYQPAQLAKSPLGAWFQIPEDKSESSPQIIFFHGGWGKVAAAASAQYAIDFWKPDFLINAGTCGGFAGRIGRGQIITATRTVIYDIEERMTDQAAVIRRYTTEVSTDWLRDASLNNVLPVVIATGDQDLDPEKTAFLYQQYGAIVADWESGAIAWVAQRNLTPLIILRLVTDLVSHEAGEAYGDWAVYQKATQKYMLNVTATVRQLIASLT